VVGFGSPVDNVVVVMIAAPANTNTERPGTDPWRPQVLKGFSVGVIVGGLCVGMTLLRVSVTDGHSASLSEVLPLSGRTDAVRRVQAFRDEAGLTAAEGRKLRDVLAEGQQTWETAAAYFASMEGADGIRDHRDEIDEVVADSVRARLVEALGATRARRAELRFGSLAALVAEMSPGH
jgi:hypothetical protein